MLSFNHSLGSVTILSLALLTSCGTSDSQVISPTPSAAAVVSPTSATSTPAPSLASAPNSKPTPDPATLAAGVYCYVSKTPTLDAKAKLTLDANSNVTGTLQGVIHNKAMGYYSSYHQTLLGVRKGNQVKMAIATDIENDHQKSNETWTMTSQTLMTGRDSLAFVDCRRLNQLANTTDSAASSPSAAPTSTEAIQFASGASSATLKGGVVRGERKTYRLNAGKNQTMTLNITSLENNAVFDLIAPNGTTLKREATSHTQTLASTGDYQIVIGGTRGNTSYNLTVEVK
jgi:hypothetical protein